jgi:hypothetical protein
MEQVGVKSGEKYNIYICSYSGSCCGVLVKVEVHENDEKLFFIIKKITFQLNFSTQRVQLEKTEILWYIGDT